MKKILALAFAFAAAPLFACDYGVGVQQIIVPQQVQYQQVQRVIVQQQYQQVQRVIVQPQYLQQRVIVQQQIARPRVSLNLRIR